MEIIQIAGFLGCGKTTLLLKIAGILSGHVLYGEGSSQREGEP